MFATLARRGAVTTLVVGVDDYVDPLLHRLGRAEQAEPWPGVRLERMRTHDHMFVLGESQETLQALLDRELERALELTPSR
jgi:hypothetical protein